ncbi:MAG: SDR family oxidoreductase, partial [Gammaproteobacteria bacterium]|nr:SDR family oxidoreductase [Gammaproteobacteria bacterium]
AKEGAQLAICARTASKLDDAEAAIKKLGLGTKILKLPTDISDRAQCKALVEQTIDRFGRVDALINSAYASGKFEPVESADLEDWRKTMDTNLFGSMNMTQEVIPYMKNQGAGSVVMVNTMATRRPMQYQAGYAVSKGALKTATASLAFELGKHGIRFNSTFMGWMWGPPVEWFVNDQAKQAGIKPEAMRAEIAKNIPLGDIPDDADCAKPVIFLASDYACAITGACLDVNGGDYLP